MLGVRYMFSQFRLQPSMVVGHTAQADQQAILGCDTFGPRTFGPPQLVPKNRQTNITFYKIFKRIKYLLEKFGQTTEISPPEINVAQYFISLSLILAQKKLHRLVHSLFSKYISNCPLKLSYLVGLFTKCYIKEPAN